MSKKKSVIMNDDPLAWLQDEASVEAPADDIKAETQTLASAVEQVPAENTSMIREETDNGKQSANGDDIAAGLIKENAIAVDSNEEGFLVGAEIADETKIDLEIDSKSFNSKALAAAVCEQDPPPLSENNEEDVVMATSNKEKIILEEDVSIVQVAVLKEAWLPALDSGKDIAIDASAVEDIDTAGLQLLLSLVKTASNSGRSVTWESPSEAVINAVKETSLRDALGIQL